MTTNRFLALLVNTQALVSDSKNPRGVQKVLSLPPGGARPGVSSGRGPRSLPEDALPLSPTPQAPRPERTSFRPDCRDHICSPACPRGQLGIPAARGLLKPAQRLWASNSGSPRQHRHAFSPGTSCRPLLPQPLGSGTGQRDPPWPQRSLPAAGFLQLCSGSEQPCRAP